MIFYTITDTLPVVPDWSSITGDLKAGTPISIKGAVANDEAAIGLVAGDTAHGAEYAVVVTAGVVDLNAASASYGSTISDDVVQALDNVTFIYGGKVYAVSGSSLPDYSQASNGDVLAIESGEPGWVTPSSGGYLLLTVGAGGAVSGATPDEVRAAATEGKPIFIKWGSAVRPAAVEGLSGKSGYVRMWGATVNSDPMTGDAPLIFKWEISFNSSSFGNCTNTTYSIGS